MDQKAPSFLPKPTYDLAAARQVIKRGFTNYLPRGLNFLKQKNYKKTPKNDKKSNIYENFGFFFKILKNKQNLQVKFASKICK